ncbi:MAG: hypothetical protein LBB40_03540 [Holophagales bacterium]|jgi:hypothetical protein|nr:hypothetical protein [Holophagales bacterium]
MSDLNNGLKNAAQKSSAATAFNSTGTDGHSGEQPAAAEEFREEQAASRTPYAPLPRTDNRAELKKRVKPLIVFGIFCTALAIAAMVFSDSSVPDTSHDAKAALSDKVSTLLEAGVILSDTDEDIGEQDYTLTHEPTDQESTKIWVWDYAAEDGDYVQVLVNGVPHGLPFMIKHKPVLLSLSMEGLVGAVQIKGVRDGRGGITYAVRFEMNNTTYFNSAPVGGLNTYTLQNATN